MKNNIVIVSIFVFLLTAIFTFIYLGRVVSNNITPLSLHVPKQGITCAMATTDNNVAISCWKDKE